MVSKRNDDDIGIQIRNARRARSWTQQELAARSKLSKNMIGRYERGDDVPTLRTLPQLLSVLEVGIRIGEHTVSVSGPRAAELRDEPLQFLLDLQHDYSYAIGPDTSLRIRPSSQGIFITAERLKSGRG